LDAPLIVFSLFLGNFRFHLTIFFAAYLAFRLPRVEEFECFLPWRLAVFLVRP
jgi:hypothetical protein